MVLLGAGCSVEAGIPASKDMTEVKIEKELLPSSWKEYSKLYHYVKSAILYSDGIQGKPMSNFDVERLVNVLNELEKKDNSTLYPFTSGWNTKLLELANYDFGIINRFRLEILRKLRSWVTIKDYKLADYYRKFFDLQSEYNFELRIFSLNYDLCLERNKPDGYGLERGFNPQTRRWDWRRFEANEAYPTAIYLYKMHGSIDWERDNEHGNILAEVDNQPEMSDLVFGTDYKMQYIDPYLFYFYEFRKYSLESKVILTIGYSFRDEHINGILVQALENDMHRKILMVSPQARDIKERLKTNPKFTGVIDRILPVEQSAKQFLQDISIGKIKEICR